ncbi:glycoside hydrolase family 3 C-terminal domain-containing protein [Mucilaginibacter sp. AW1-3]
MKIIFLSFTLCLCSILWCQAQHHPQTDKEIAAKIDHLIGQMTLEEKVGMIHGNSLFTSAGVKRLGIPDLVMSDGPHGVRLEHGFNNYVRPKDLQDAGTYLPTGVCLAATWNPALGYQFGAVLGSEASYRGKDVILGPGINIIRTALNGRNFEYQSEDPFLISQMAVGYIKGVQDQGVSACVKHFIANNQELLRTSIDVQMSDRALNEIYLPGFKAAVTIGKVNTLMGSYNKFRGQWATHNNYLIGQILKKDWGFKGMVISDWGAVHSTDQALWNGTDLEMGTDIGMRPKVDYGKFYMGDTVVHLIRTGKIPEYLINEKVRRILYVMFKTNMIDGKRKPGEYNTKAHQQTALKIAEEGIVLLKNEHKTLPLTPATRSIAVIGYNAAREQALGGGSSQVKAFYEVTPLEGLKNVAGKNVNITYTQGYKIERGAGSDATMIEEAAQAASKADVAIVVGGWTHGYNYAVWKDNAYDAEDTDKPDMLMPFGQDELIRAVLKANPKTVVVLMGGGPIDMTQWIDNTPAVIQAWYPGMEGGNALAKIIFGQIDPSGKLPMSFPKRLEDEPAHKLGEYPGNGVTANYTDDIYVGYRYYDTFNVAPQFAFGHGLSYTTFKYSDLRISTNNGKTIVSFKIKNTGTMAGAETAQLYIKQEKLNLPRPEKELKGFEKLFLKAGEEKMATLTLSKDAFQYFNDLKSQWVSDAGFFDVIIGSSSKDIRLTGRIYHQ